jgi:hypothetical protein
MISAGNKLVAVMASVGTTTASNWPVVVLMWMTVNDLNNRG